MKSKASKVACPKCGTQIDVDILLRQQMSDELKTQFDAQLEKERQSFDKQKESLAKKEGELKAEKKKQAALVAATVEEHVAKERESFEKQRDALAKKECELKAETRKQAALVATTVEDALKKARKEQEKTVKAELMKEQAEGLKLLKKELEEKSKQLIDLNRTKAALERLQRAKDEMAEKMAAEAELTLTKKLKEETTKIRKVEEERQQLRIAEKEKTIADLDAQLKDARRLVAQGSMQLQGEVQELAIEEWLRGQFPFDTIEEVKKGQRGGDCLQTVNTQTRLACGTIYFESKRTKAFQPAWIAKFKDDLREKNADIGVLVTEAMPSGMERMGLVDGVLICSFVEFKGLCAVLRESIIRYSSIAAAQENKGEKSIMLYDFLTGNEFRGMVEAIVEGFTQMQTDLESEKRAMNGIWKKRGKQIEKVLLNTGSMYSSIRGIAGSAVQPVKLLELPTE